MNTSNTFRSSIKQFIFLIVIFSLSGCSVFQNTVEPDNSSSSESTIQYHQNVPYAEVRFFLQIPDPVEEDIVFEIVDDVTGIEFNPTRYSMEKINDKSYQITFPAKLGSTVKYRYFRNGGLPIYETDYQNNPISYRVAYVNTASEFSDILTNWSDQIYSYEYGKLQGQVINSVSKSPIPNAFVVVGGRHTFTNSQGFFTINLLPPGKHNLVVLSTDGEYQIFQQETIIGEGLTTPASIEIAPSNFVNLTFVVHQPQLINNESIVRIVGNTFQTGNIFTEVYNGENVIASRAPILSQLPDGSSTITLSLPVGFEFVYKYTLGSGFWNAELTSDGNFNTRHIIVPENDTLITDVIDNWVGPGTAPSYFKVSVPENTPENDIVSIQFSPFGWSSPIPMTKIGTNIWSYTLYGPLNMVGNVNYRFCRNDACGTADDSFSAGNSVSGYSFEPGTETLVLENTIESWINWTSKTTPTAIIAPEIKDRGPEFITGIQFNSNNGIFDPVYAPQAVQNLKDLGANSLILPVEWTMQSLNPLIMSPLPADNLLWKDLVKIINFAQKSGLNVILTPVMVIDKLPVTQYMQADLPGDWVDKFGSSYEEFLRYTVDLASFMNISEIILPSESYAFSKTDNYSEIKNMIISHSAASLETFKQSYSGKFILSIQDVNNLPAEEFLSSYDGFIVKSDWNLGTISNDNSGLTSSYKNYLDEVVVKLYESTSKPVYLDIEFPSAIGAESGCVSFGEECLDFDLLNLAGTELRSSIMVDLLVQVDLYQAALTAINDTSWVQGVVSNGFNDIVALQDASSSVRGKPSADVLWYWFPRMTGSVK